ncbi:MAG: hypothetical protein QXF12_02355 [Candidatus Aenigmatarchaeota archaeon]
MVKEIFKIVSEVFEEISHCADFSKNNKIHQEIIQKFKYKNNIIVSVDNIIENNVLGVDTIVFFMPDGYELDEEQMNKISDCMSNSIKNSVAFGVLDPENIILAEKVKINKTISAFYSYLNISFSGLYLNYFIKQKYYIHVAPVSFEEKDGTHYITSNLISLELKKICIDQNKIDQAFDMIYDIVVSLYGKKQ